MSELMIDRFGLPAGTGKLRRGKKRREKACGVEHQSPLAVTSVQLQFIGYQYCGCLLWQSHKTMLTRRLDI